MTTFQKEMLDKARERWGVITFPGRKESWDDCFTEYKGVMILWFNVLGGSTSMVGRKISNGEYTTKIETAIIKATEALK